MTYLQQYEPKVPNIGYAGHTKFVCGIVLNIHDTNYFAPNIFEY
ncbi:type III toxin-antitoxin system ToxN/AbiQ family toxin [Megasphaera stantonii]